MTDWGRDITELWVKIKWLQSFSVINRKATKNATEKFMK